jgi:hypothetical protein
MPFGVVPWPGVFGRGLGTLGGVWRSVPECVGSVERDRTGERQPNSSDQTYLPRECEVVMADFSGGGEDRRDTTTRGR